MEIRNGTIVNGAIVLEDENNLEEDAPVTVCIGDRQQPMRITEKELWLIEDGKAAATRGELVDTRRFPQKLRRGG